MVTPPVPDQAQIAEAMSQMPGSGGAPMPGDFIGTALFSFIIPLVIGVGAVYIVIMLKPDAIMSSGQMVEYKRLEKRRELKRRGAKDLGGKKETRAARRARVRSQLRGGKSDDGDAN